MLCLVVWKTGTKRQKNLMRPSSGFVRKDKTYLSHYLHYFTSQTIAILKF
jgi:hypothetical protein